MLFVRRLIIGVMPFLGRRTSKRKSLHNKSSMHASAQKKRRLTSRVEQLKYVLYILDISSIRISNSFTTSTLFCCSFRLHLHLFFTISTFLFYSVSSTDCNVTRNNLNLPLKTATDEEMLFELLINSSNIRYPIIILIHSHSTYYFTISFLILFKNLMSVNYYIPKNI